MRELAGRARAGGANSIGQLNCPAGPTTLHTELYCPAAPASKQAQAWSRSIPSVERSLMRAGTPENEARESCHVDQVQLYVPNGPGRGGRVRVSRAVSATKAWGCAIFMHF